MSFTFKRYAKRITAIFLMLVLVFSLPACSFSNDKDKHGYTSNDQVNNAEFSSFINDLFRDSIHDTVSLHCYLQHPQDYGIDDYDVTLGRYDLDNLDNTSDIVDSLNRLKSFDKNSLSNKQQLTYEELQKYLETELEYSDLYMFDTELSTTIGIQVQLPILFAEYSFYEEKDVTEYLALLCDTDGYFKNMVDYEACRSEKGYFMEDSLVDKIISQCQTFVDSADDGYLISTFDDKLASVENLSDQAKTTYKEQNAKAIAEHLVPGYQILIEGLKKLKGTNKCQGGLCNYPNGKKYYEYLLSKEMGWSKTVDDYNALLDTYLKKSMVTMQLLTTRDTTLMNKFSSFSFSMTDPNTILTDLQSRIGNDFPTGPKVNYNIKYIAESLQDYASPAMYFTPQIDNLNVNSIYINPKGTDGSELYPTLAHEGYPGHMYQLTYFSNSNPDLIRYLIEPAGYIEGWATYTELFSYGYANTGNAALNSLAQTNHAAILFLYAKVDIGVNYYGWKVADVLDFMKNYGFSDPSIAEQMYASMLSEPGNYCKYVLGYIGFSELKAAAKTALSDRFNNKAFHQYILDMGPVQFDILFNHLDAWTKTQP
jgi:uncharacterized protein (DUF885 family)